MADYEFLPYTHRKSYKRDGKPPISGYYDITVTTQQPLRVGSGFSAPDTNNMKAELLRSCGAPVIPGSSLKGFVRAVASAVSESCMPKEAKGEWRSPRQMEMAEHKCDPNDRCIVCDTFGLMSFASRVEFGDLKAPENTEVIVEKVPVPFPPNADKTGYHTSTADGEESNGSKFYHKQNPPPAGGMYGPPAEYSVEAVKANTVFKGRVYFHGVTEEELSLLLFSLGCDGTFQPKLGGNRAHGYGSVKIALVKPYHYIGGTPTRSAPELAKAYYDSASEECRKNIDALRKILSKEVS